MCIPAKKQGPFTLPEGFTVTAHAGAFGTPDNSAESVRRALDEGVDIIEMDVTFRPSGTPVIIHSGAPAETEGIPLDEILAMAAESKTVRLNLDLKSVANLSAVDSLLQKYGLSGRAFYTGVGADWAPAVKANSAVPYYLNCPASRAEKTDPAAAAALAEKISALGAIGLNVHYGDASALTVRAVHAAGLLASLWTANTKSAMLRCLAMAPDNITTRKPDELYRILSENR